MQIRGKIIAISNNVAEVCIIKEDTLCGSCDTCPKKMGIQDVMKVVAIHGMQVGQEVILRDTKNWFTRNRILIVLLAFVLGTIVAELLSKSVSFSVPYHKELDLIGGCLAMMIMLVVLWVKRPKYLFRVELREGGKT